MVKQNLESAKNAIREAIKNSSTSSTQVTLLAVTKKQSHEKISELVNCDHKVLGENYVQEFLDKYQKFKPENIDWHFIGSLQRNKVKLIVDKVRLIHSVDSKDLLDEINKRSQKKQSVLVQVNLDQEASKGGISVQDVPSLSEYSLSLENVVIKGFMFMPPFRTNPEENRSYFQRGRQLRDKLQQQFIDKIDLSQLSMGTSQDYIVAVEEGATIVRLGQSLLGSRD